jgi:BirA family biotin operon repressor/biotin-[acetyl-CoA-carboxylase] ligase
MNLHKTYHFSGFTIYEYFELDSTNKTANHLLLNQQIHDKQVILAISQTNGVGKNQRVWQSLTGNLFCSVVVQIASEFCSNYTQLSLLTAVAMGQTFRQIKPDLPINYKWPNDILIDDKKVAGLLAQQIGDGVIVGIGLNVAMDTDELPVPTATSLALSGSNNLDRNLLLSAFLNRFENIFKDWDSGTEFLEKYRQVSSTLGRQVRVEVLGRESIEAEAAAITAQGALILSDGTEVNVGDVVHLR